MKKRLFLPILLIAFLCVGFLGGLNYFLSDSSRLASSEMQNCVTVSDNRSVEGAIFNSSQTNISGHVTISLGNYGNSERVGSDSDEVMYYTYTGSAITPPITVYYPSSWNNEFGWYYASERFVKGTHWTMSYSNNTEVGTASVTVTGIGEFTGSVTKTFNIVNILPSEQNRIDQEKSDARLMRIIWAVIVCLPILIYAIIKTVKHSKRKKRFSDQPSEDMQYLKDQDKGRSSLQMDLFYKSKRYLEWREKSQGSSEKLKKFLKIISIILFAMFACCAITILLSIFTPLSYLFMGLSIALAVTCIVVSIVSKKHDAGENYSLRASSITYGADVCKKCAGDYQLFWGKAEFSRKDVNFVTETLKENQKPYLGTYDEITGVQRVEKKKIREHYDSQLKRTVQKVEIYYEDIYSIKRVHYLYNVPATCKACSGNTVLSREGRNPDEVDN